MPCFPSPHEFSKAEVVFVVEISNFIYAEIRKAFALLVLPALFAGSVLLSFLLEWLHFILRLRAL